MKPEPVASPVARFPAQLADHYQVERELGAGGMATVYLAHDKRHDRKVALKVLRPELGAAIGTERFLHEIKVTANLQHPHILPLFDSGRTDQLVYYVMPFVEGESLRQRLGREKQLTVDEAIRIATEVASALDYAHRQGVIHRDIKPENILLHEGRALVADFGIARAVSSAGGSRLTETGISLGTPQYMSPEQATGERELDGRTDVYSLGAVLYEMLAGEAPHVGPTAQAILARVVADRPRPLRQLRRRVPPWVENAVDRALAATPADRFSTASGLVEALRPPRGATMLAAPRVLVPAIGIVALLAAAVILLVSSGRDRSDAATPARSIQSREVPAAGDAVRSIAVLPFDNLSPDRENQYFSDGITDDIITQLSKIGAFKVISRTSSMRYKHTDKSMREIAAELGVSALLQGAVRRDGGRLRITTQLMDARTDLNLWAETYDRDLQDVFAIQSEVALRVAAALQAVLTPTERARVQQRGTESIEAYDLLVLGRGEASKRNAEGLRRAVRHFEAAIERDPGFAAAYAGLADAYTLSAIAYQVLPPADALARAKEAARRAIAIDETDADAHAALGYVLTNEWDFANARLEFERAIELNPSLAKAHQWYGHYYIYTRDFDAAEVEATRALELDPLSVVLTNELGWPDDFRGDARRGRERHLRALEMDSTFAMAYYNLGLTYELEGKYDQAIALHEKAARLSGGLAAIKANLAGAYARTGQRDRARAILRELDEAVSMPGRPMYIAHIAEALGETDATLDWLEKAFEARSPFMTVIGTPVWPFPTIRDHPRFVALLAKLGVRGQPSRRRRRSGQGRDGIHDAPLRSHSGMPYLLRCMEQRSAKSPAAGRAV